MGEKYNKTKIPPEVAPPTHSRVYVRLEEIIGPVVNGRMMPNIANIK